MTPNWQTTYNRMLRALSVRPHSYAELMSITGWTRPTVQKYLDTLREEKTVRIAQWAEDSRGHPVVPLFANGAAADAPRQGRSTTSTERMRRMRERRKAEA